VNPADPDPTAVGNEPDADFFDLILETDLANIIKKAQAGQPLTKREREMIEEERTRRAKNAPLAGFQLEGEGAIPALERMTQAELGEIWGYSTKQIKNWLRDGRKANDPAPVTRPDLMCAWFARIHAPREAPERLRAAAQRILEGHRPPEKSKGSSSQPVEKIEIAEEEKGLLAMLDRYRTAEVTLHNKYMAAVDAGDETKAGFLLSEWSKMGEKVRALEKSAPKALEDLKIYVRRDEIQRELEPLHSAILKAFKQEFRQARIRLKATANPDEWALEVDRIVEQVARILVETEFREPLELETTPPAAAA